MAPPGYASGGLTKDHLHPSDTGGGGVKALNILVRMHAQSILGKCTRRSRRRDGRAMLARVRVARRPTR